MKQICTKCNINKPIKDFPKNSTSNNKYTKRCKVCVYTQVQKYHKTIDGLVAKIFNSQNSTSKRRGYTKPTYTQNDLKKWIVSQPNFQELYDNWVKSKYLSDLSPSCDRHNDTGDYDYLPYSLDRLILTTFKKNREKLYYDKRNGINNKNNRVVIQYSLDFVQIAEYHSLREAARVTGVAHSTISNLCSGKYKKGKLFNWKYKQF